MAWHIDPVLNRPVKCSNEACRVASADHHFSHRGEAEEAIAIDSAFSTSPTPSELVFRAGKSETTGLLFLESFFVNSLGELVIISAEEHETYSVGGLLIGSREYGLARIEGEGELTLNSCAKLSLNAAVRDFEDELWPSANVIALHESLAEASTDEDILAPGKLAMSLMSDSSGHRSYSGHTASGVEIAVTVGSGYAVARADLNRSSSILYEANLNEHEGYDANRARFVAKAFGELVAARV